VGETNPVALAQHATALRAKGITTSTFGLGSDFDEELMSSLAASGGGHFYFIEKPVQISDFFLSEIGEALEVVARDARVVIAGAPGIEISCLNQFPVDQTSTGNVSIRLGDLVSEQEVTMIIGVRCTAGALGSTVGITVRLADREHALFAEPMSVEWRVTDAIEDDAQPISAEVLIEVAKLLADGARTRALEANRRGEYDRAAEILRTEADTIRALAPDCGEVQAIADDLFRERVLYQDSMSASEIKGRHFASMNAMYSRSPQGRARKRASTS
jgi:Ca-activated chloride channel homolog